MRGYSAITRQDGARRCRLSAAIDERFANAEQIVSDMEAEFLPRLEQRYPGIRYLIDGQRKRINESLGSLLRGGCIAAVVIFALLGTVLRSYVQPIIIMAAIPLGMIGAVAGHAVLGFELTLMSAFGMVALAGIIVNDALVLVDQVNKNLAGGMEPALAISSAAQTRFRAVILTTVTTFAGLTPLIIERSSQAQSLIPLAISIAFGELFGTLLTLLVIPAALLVVNDLKRVVHWLWHGGAYPTAQEVEGDVSSGAVATE